MIKIGDYVIANTSTSRFMFHDDKLKVMDKFIMMNNECLRLKNEKDNTMFSYWEFCFKKIIPNILEIE